MAVTSIAPATRKPENTRIWDRLYKTDPKHTKQFQRAGGFKGTAIKPIYSIERMTEEFGPVGVGWGITQPFFQVVEAGDETMVYCTVGVWIDEGSGRSDPVPGVGGDVVVKKRKDGSRQSDDEAFKKAYTDAVSNALKFFGVGADVHMGQFEDSKYVAEVEQEKRVEEQIDEARGMKAWAAETLTRIAGIASLDDYAWLKAEIVAQMAKLKTVDQGSYRQLAQAMQAKHKELAGEQAI